MIDEKAHEQYQRDTAVQPKGLESTPDLPDGWRDDPGMLNRRESFRVGMRTFTRINEGGYSDGTIKACCDQQDTTSWRACVGPISTAWYWTPEMAVMKFLESVQSVPVSDDLVNHPPHYTDHPSGVECIAITEHMNFCLGNAIKYIWRAGLKSSDPSQDLRKARWYLDRELSRLADGGQ